MTEAAAALAEEIGQWLRSGRVQSPDGAFCAWLDAASGELAFEYPEITGYALTWLCPNAADGAPEVEIGHRAARWLVKRLRAGDRSARTGYDNGAVYTFDLGMIAAGLMSFGRATDSPEYVELGAELAGELAAWVRDGGELPPVAPGGPPSSRPQQWSTAARSHLVKCVQSLLLAHEQQAAASLCELALAAQDAHGWFPTSTGDSLMLHPLLYVVEGLWIAGRAMGETRFIESASRATRWVWQQRLPSGGLPRSVSPAGPGVEQFDVTAQAVRAAVLLKLECPGLEAGVQRLRRVARSDNGFGSALIYQPHTQASQHLNAWVSMFGEQALRVFAEGPQALSWETLV
jgi:hypothetical protein